MAVFDNMTGINLAASFVLQSQAPLDARSVVSSTSELDELVSGYGAYTGMLVYVTNESAFYKYDEDDGWTKFGTAAYVNTQSSLDSTDNTNIPTSKAVADYIEDNISGTLENLGTAAYVDTTSEISSTDETNVPTNKAVTDYISNIISTQTGVASELDIDWTDDETMSDTVTIMQICDISTGHTMQMLIDQNTNDFGHRIYNANSKTWSEWVLHGNEGSVTYCILSYKSNSIDTDGNSIIGDISNMPTMEIWAVGTAGTITTDEPTCDGYVFKGWNTAADGSGTSYSTGDSLTITSESGLTLYAQWELDTYTVKFMDYAGTTSIASYTVTRGKALSTAISALPTAESATGYSFSYWYYVEDGSNTKITLDTIIESDLTVYAYYAVKYVTLTIYYPTVTSSSATSLSWGTDSVSVQEGTTWGNVSLPNRINSKYTGWTISGDKYKDSDYSSTWGSNEQILSASEAYVLYWYSNSCSGYSLPAYYYVISKDSSTATYTGVRGTGEEIVYGTVWSDIIALSPTVLTGSAYPDKDDYTISSVFYTDADCTEQLNSNRLFTHLNSYEIIYANYWTTYTASFSIVAPSLEATTVTYNGVTYDVDAYEFPSDHLSATSVDDIESDSDGYVTLPSALTLTTSYQYFTFSGWLNENTGSLCDPNDDVIINNDTTFVSVWKAKSISGTSVYNTPPTVNDASTEASTSSLVGEEEDLVHELSASPNVNEIIILENPLNYLTDKFGYISKVEAESAGEPIYGYTDQESGWSCTSLITANTVDNDFDVGYADNEYGSFSVTNTRAYYVMDLISQINDQILELYYERVGQTEYWYSTLNFYPKWYVYIYYITDFQLSAYYNGEGYTMNIVGNITDGSANTMRVEYYSSPTIPACTIEYDGYTVSNWKILKYNGTTYGGDILDTVDLSSGSYTVDTITCPLLVVPVLTPNTYTITWHDPVQYRDVLTETYYYGDAISIPASISSTYYEGRQSGYSDTYYSGIFYHEDGSVFTESDVCRGNETITIGSYTESQTYTLKIVYYSVEDSSSKTITQSSVTSGTSISNTTAYSTFYEAYETMIDDGYGFGGVYSDSSYSTSYASTISSFSNKSVTSDLTLYVKFTTSVKFGYSYDGGFDTINLTTKTITLGKTYYSAIGTASAIKTEVTSSGETLPSGSFNWSYMFSGQLGNQYDNPTVSAVSGTKISSAKICIDNSISYITALYNPSSTRTVTFNSSNLVTLGGTPVYTLNGSSDTQTNYSVTGKIGWYYSIPTVSDSSDIEYEFNGWTSDSSGTKSAGFDSVSGTSIVQIPTSAKTYYSQWSSDEEVTVKIYYYTDTGAQTSVSSTVNVGTSLSSVSAYSTLSNRSTSNGDGSITYTFDGVYTSSTYSTEVSSSTIITGNLTLYAKYTAPVNVYYTYNYGYSDGDYSNSVKAYMILGKTVYYSLYYTSGVLDAILSEAKSALDSDLTTAGNTTSSARTITLISIYDSFAYNSPGTIIRNKTCNSTNCYSSIYMVYRSTTSYTVTLSAKALTDLGGTACWYDSDDNLVSSNDVYSVTSYAGYHIAIPYVEDDNNIAEFTEWYSDSDLTEEYDEDNWGDTNKYRYIELTKSLTLYSGWETTRDYSNVTWSVAKGSAADYFAGSSVTPKYTNLTSSTLSAYTVVDINGSVKFSPTADADGTLSTVLSSKTYRTDRFSSSTRWSSSKANTSLSVSSGKGYAYEREYSSVIVSDMKIVAGDKIQLTDIKEYYNNNIEGEYSEYWEYDSDGVAETKYENDALPAGSYVTVNTIVEIGAWNTSTNSWVSTFNTVQGATNPYTVTTSKSIGYSPSYEYENSDWTVSNSASRSSSTSTVSSSYSDGIYYALRLTTTVTTTAGSGSSFGVGVDLSGSDVTYTYTRSSDGDYDSLVYGYYVGSFNVYPGHFYVNGNCILY